MDTNIIQSTMHLLENAFRDTPSGKTCQLALLAACYPGHYQLEFSNLFCLDGKNTRAALNVLTYRLVEFESIESIIGPDNFSRLHDAWWRDHPENQTIDAC